MEVQCGLGFDKQVNKGRKLHQVILSAGHWPFLTKCYKIGILKPRPFSNHNDCPAWNHFIKGNITKADRRPARLRQTKAKQTMTSLCMTMYLYQSIVSDQDGARGGLF